MSDWAGIRRVRDGWAVSGLLLLCCPRGTLLFSRLLVEDVMALAGVFPLILKLARLGVNLRVERVRAHL